MSLLDLEKEDAVERSEVTFIQPYLHPDLDDPGVAVSGNLVKSVWCGYSGSPVESNAWGTHNSDSLGEGLEPNS